MGFDSTDGTSYLMIRQNLKTGGNYPLLDGTDPQTELPVTTNKLWGAASTDNNFVDCCLHFCT